MKYVSLIFLLVAMILIAGCSTENTKNSSINTQTPAIATHLQKTKITDGVIKITNFEIKKTDRYESTFPKDKNIFWVFNAAIDNSTTSQLIAVDFSKDNSVSKLITKEGTTFNEKTSKGYVVYSNPRDIFDSDYIVTGVELVFEIPETNSPKEILLVYSYKENNQTNILKKGEFLIPL